MIGGGVYRSFALVLVAAALSSACGRDALSPAEVAATTAPGGDSADDLGPALLTDPELAAMLDDATRRRMQVLVAVPVEATESGSEPALRRLAFRADAEYFYPASAIKLCAAVAALEKLDELRRGRADLALSTPLRIVEGDERKMTETTLHDEIERALVISDNEAFNHLFEFVGRDELAERMTRLGLRSTRIVHHVGAVGDDAQPSFELLGSGAPIPVGQRIGFVLPGGDVDGIQLGTAYVDAGGRRVDAPFDFADKNRMSLHDLQALLVSVMRPELALAGVPKLAAADRESLVAILGALPSELSPRAPRYLDDLHKPLSSAVRDALPGHDVRVYGKGGRAYGFMIENSYVVDATTGRSAFVAAAIYSNDNDTINDDHYDYASVGRPFLERVGHVVAHAFLGARSGDVGARARR